MFEGVCDGCVNIRQYLIENPKGKLDRRVGSVVNGETADDHDVRHLKKKEHQMMIMIG